MLARNQLPTSMAARRNDRLGHQRRRPETERMPRGENDLKLQLKSGAEVNVRDALAECDDLERLLRLHSRDFQVLLGIARGRIDPDRSANLSPAERQSVDSLTEARYLIDKAIHPMTRDVLLSAYHETPDGPAIVQPFKLANTHEKLIVERVASRMDDRSAKWMRKFFGGDEPGQQSR
jgi:hypothetical protein